jgi:hypothetical protein
LLSRSPVSVNLSVASAVEVTVMPLGLPGPPGVPLLEAVSWLVRVCARFFRPAAVGFPLPYQSGCCLTEAAKSTRCHPPAEPRSEAVFSTLTILV